VGRASNRKKVVEMAGVLSIGRDTFGYVGFDIEWHSTEAKSAVDAAAVSIGQSTEDMLRGMAQYLYQTEGEGDYQMSTEDLRQLTTPIYHAYIKGA